MRTFRGDSEVRNQNWSVAIIKAKTTNGGWIANTARLLTMTIAILLTIYRDQLWKPLASEGNVADETTEQSCRGGPVHRKLANLNEPFLIWRAA